MSVLTHTVSNCKFEATDPSSDEVVLTRILRLIRVTVMSEVGQKTLDDKAICEMVETAFGMCFQGRVSELLKKSAEQTLVILVQVLFERLTQILKVKEHNDRLKSAVTANNETSSTVPSSHAAASIIRSLKSRQKGDLETVFASSTNKGTEVNGTDSSNGPVVISIADSLSSSGNNEPEMISVGHDDASSDLEIKLDLDLNQQQLEQQPKVQFQEQPLLEAAEKNSDDVVKSSIPSAAPSQETEEQHNNQKEQSSHRAFAPFGLPAILELVRVLVTLMDPRNRSHTDSTHRFIALTLLNVGVEVGGRSLGKWIGWGYEVEAEKATRGTDVAVSDEEKMAVACKELVVNELVKFLFQFLQNTNMTYNSPPSSNNMTLLSMTLRVLTALFQTSRHFLKFQFEYFLNWIMSKVDAGVVSWDVTDIQNNTTSTPEQVNAQQNVAGRNVLVAEARELLLETMVQCCRIPGFFTELWVNFDGDGQCQGNLYEEVVRFLSKHTFPDATPGGPVTMINHQVQCVDGLMLLLKHLSERKSGMEIGVTAMGLPESLYHEPSPEELLAVKRRKKLLAQGAERFNSSPKAGIKFLQEQELLPTPADPHSIAVFLKTTPGVNKKLIGEYIAKRGNEDILKTFIKLYNFKGKRLDEGLRLLLESFRLPGEAQLIERVVENFAEGYFQAMEDTQDHHIADQSAGFVLAFSIILLNTDQHNPQVRRRMTPEDFQRNNRGCNNGKDFDPEYLRAIYDAIKHNEIVMPEEHEGDLGFSYAWKELLKKSETANPLMSCPRGSFSKDMFQAISVSTIAAISYAFDSSEDSLTLQKAIVGLHRCASIASLYQITDVLDSIVISLSKTTGLLKDHGKLPAERKLDDSLGVSSPNNRPDPVRADPWAVDFGRNYKSQVACVLMFNLASEYGNSLRLGWKNIVDILGNLFLHSLLPSNMLTADNFIRRGAQIPRLLVKEKEAPQKEPVGGGLFFSLAQLLNLGGGDDVADLPPTAEELDAEQSTISCITCCRIEELFLETRFLEESSLQHLLAIITQACYVLPKLTHRPSQSGLFQNGGNETNAEVAAKSPENAKLLNPAESPSTPVVAAGANKPAYSLSVAFYVELIVNITFHNRDRLKVVWPVAFELISKILSGDVSGLEHPPLLERAVVGLLRLLIRMVHKDDMLPQVFQSLDMLTSLPVEVLNIVAEQLMAGLLQVIKTDPSLILRYPRWDAVLHLLSGTAMHPEASRFSLEAACILVSSDTNSPLTAESFGDCVDLLLSFVTSAGGIVLNSTAQVGSPDGRGSVTSPRVVQKNLNAQAATERALKALDKLFSLSSKIPALVSKAGIGRERIWFEFWLPLLSGLAQQCYNPGREIRQHSLTLLQRSLLSSEVESTVMVPKPNASGGIDDITSSTLETGVDVFENVLFPLLEELLKPEIRRLDASGMDETRMRVAALLCKIFLQYLNRLARFKDLPVLWIKVLDCMNRYVNAGGSEFVSEGVLESLKNMLLVMSTQRIFQPNPPAPQEAEGPQVSQHHNLWEITWQHIDKVYPGLRQELFSGSDVKV
ncbi:hypothetical protein BDR26DRAFT_859844 [Obelidium mucronatum]|nr:hypothetical protein BDR26DRAFT_859844 [Obelidium mucronatum]